MTNDEQERRNSRARAGGSARPAGDAAPPRGGAARGSAAGSAVPPSFAPGGAGARPSAQGAVPVGGPPSPGSSARPARPAQPARPGSPRTPPQATPAQPVARRGAGGEAAAVPPRRTTSAGGQPTVVPGRPAGAAQRTAAPATASPVRPAARQLPPGAVPGRTAPGGPGRGGPAGPGAGGSAGPTVPGTRRRRRRLIVGVVVLVLVALIAWPVGLVMWANGKVDHVAALSGAPDTPGTTYLLAGSDSREDGVIEDAETLGARTDTIMLLQVPESGPVALISLPRDTYVDIAGYGPAKLNAAFSYGGAPLLVQTVEQLTGLTVDHYIEVGFGGIETIVDAIGGVNLCYDYDVADTDSGMFWTAGCADVNGEQALAFARMRKADPEGDVGRAKRQQQLIGAITSKVSKPSLLFQPGRQTSLIDAGTAALTVSDGSDIVDLGRLALAFRKANGPGGITGTPPISSIDYRPGNIGSTVLLDPDQTPTFFAAIRDGSLPAGPVGGMPTS